MVCMNPIFAHRARELLSGAQRILRKQVLLYALPPDQAIPEALDVMLQVCDGYGNGGKRFPP